MKLASSWSENIIFHRCYFFPRGWPFGNAEEDGKKGDLVSVPVGLTLEEVFKGKKISYERIKKSIVETGGSRDCRCR